jgi:hypothetical protein
VSAAEWTDVCGYFRSSAAGAEDIAAEAAEVGAAGDLAEVEGAAALGDLAEARAEAAALPEVGNRVNLIFAERRDECWHVMKN